MSQSPTSAQASRLPWPILAILSGVLLGLSQPIVVEPLGGSLPLDRSGLTGLLVLLGMIPAVVAIEGQGPKRAYAVGFVMWLVHFSIVIHWILYTLHIYGGLPVLVSVPILLLLTLSLIHI